ncbi:hypothetical protein [Cellulophaga fucicola]|uniref:DUF3139 domain-containing protein n=1 Tax=Cellulophaga fucicola TaxID=76595 RepID=A0A1K1QJJ7_9FLAO|nr:hypothetical protein [Cellulophaga fucicola]SFW60106.1 hypothetical protein SAMN05660313_02708 [Cellulophaga fucicola]
MKRKYLLITIGLLAVGLLFYYIGWSFSPGSYGKAETYELNVSERILIEIINEVKSENNLNTNSFADHKSKHWYSIYFEYKDKNQIIHALTRPKNKTTTTFYFANYKNKTDLGNWIDANEYFWWWKNSKAKNEFEERILERIKEKIKKRKPNNGYN